MALAHPMPRRSPSLHRGDAVLPIVLLMTIALSAGVATRSQAARMLDPLRGRWSGAASVHGREFRLSLDWQAALASRFTRLEHRLHPAAPETAPAVFEAVAYYRAIDSVSVRGEWFDTGGLQRPIRMRREGATWISDWGTPETEVGRTRYALEGDSVLAVVDSVLSRQGGWREFGRARLRRVRS